MTPAQECAQHIAVLVAGIDSKLNELEHIMSNVCPPAVWHILKAHDALTRVLAETKAAVEVQK